MSGSGSAAVADLVRDSRLPTRFLGDNAIEHSSIKSDSRARQRPVRVAHTWRRERQLGRGSFGCVWLETCVAGSRNGQLRALKEISKVGDGGLVVDYNRELEAIAKFSHYRYVSFFVESDGWFETDDAIFISMEYLPNRDLQRYLTKTWPEAETRTVAAQIVQGLVFMHENGFAHRDLKPQNILVVELGPDWWVKIGDFGISKRLEESTALRTLIGTRGYLAPELTDLRGFFARPQLEYTVSVDLWALGQIVFRLLTGKMAFFEDGVGNLVEYVIRGGPFPRPILEDVNATTSCADFIEAAMKPVPSERLTASQASSHEWISALSLDPIPSLDALHINETRPSNNEEWWNTPEAPQSEPSFAATAPWSTAPQDSTIRREPPSFSATAPRSPSPVADQRAEPHQENIAVRNNPAASSVEPPVPSVDPDREPVGSARGNGWLGSLFGKRKEANEQTDHSRLPPEPQTLDPGAFKNLNKQLQRLATVPPPAGISYHPVDDKLNHWLGIITGPAGTPYEGGKFHLDMWFPHDYPWRPPAVKFITKTFHPNITYAGSISLDILRDQWSPSICSIEKILLSISSFLDDPNPDDPVVPEIARLYKTDRAVYSNTVRSWTRVYASSQSQD